MALRDKLPSTRMDKGESVASYLTEVAQVKDELATIGEVITDSELVRIAFKGFTKEWEFFVKCVVGREKLPDWRKLWDDFTREEIREGSHSRDQERAECGANEQNVVVVGKSKDKKKDMSKVKFFACHKTVHYTSQCPNKKKKKKLEVSATQHPLRLLSSLRNSRGNFFLMTDPSSSGYPVFKDIEVWFVDSGESRYMTGMRFVFLSLSEIDSDCFVDSGASSQLAVKEVGSVRFQLESGSFLEVAEVLFIPEMIVNLFSVSALEIDGFGVAFFCGRVFLYPEGATPDTTVLLGVKHERLYRLLGQPVVGSSGFLDSESVSMSKTL